MIQSPFAWLGDQLDRAFHSVGSASDEEYWHENRRAGALTVRRIRLADLGQALRNGLADFAANRTDVIFLCILYPLVGLMLGRLASGYDVVPLLFPLAAGFAPGENRVVVLALHVGRAAVLPNPGTRALQRCSDVAERFSRKEAESHDGAPE